MYLPRRGALVDPPEYENTSSDVELRSSARAAFEKRSAQADKSGRVFAHYHCGIEAVESIITGMTMTNSAVTNKGPSTPARHPNHN
jgi:hypothetical protein